MNKKSNVIIENPENLSVDPRIEYTIKCVKEVVARRSQGSSFTNITGYIRGAKFYGQLINRGNKTKLHWADFQHEFDDNQFMQGIQLYKMPTGEYVGMVNVFDISASHRSQMALLEHGPEALTSDEKYDSVVIAITSKNIEREINSPLDINPSSYGSGNFNRHTNIVGIKNASSLGTKWAGKGVGKRLLDGIDQLFSWSHSTAPLGGKVKAEAKTVLNNINYSFKREYEKAIEEFFDAVDLRKYVSSKALIAELLFNESYMGTFKAVEHEAIGTLQTQYATYTESFGDFKENLKRVVVHDLTTNVATLFHDFNTAAPATHYGSLDALAEEHPTAEEKVAVLNIGMQNDEPEENFDVLENYVRYVGYGRYEVRSMRYAITDGVQEGRVYYFLDDSVETT
tara:strand:+ start:493 stop:1686 length:1194 start_codon:yes stop_codon:yes gene_type:complete